MDDMTEIIGLHMERLNGGVTFSTDSSDPLNFVWQDERQVKSIIAKLQSMIGADYVGYGKRGLR